MKTYRKTDILTEFDFKFYDKLQSFLTHQRGSTFRKIFEYLLDLDLPYYTILETGTCREENNWEGDGLSTLLFDWFINKTDGELTTVDLDSEATAMARKNCSGKVTACCDDSVHFLWHYKPKTTVNLVYLDSYDYDQQQPIPSMLHHLKELTSCISYLEKGCIVMVDDMNVMGSGYGKGLFIEDFFESIGATKLFGAYQAAWIL